MAGHTARRVVAVGGALALAGAVLLPGIPAHADEARDRSWHLAALDLPAVHSISQGEGIKVAIVDSGVDPKHPDLVGNVLPGADVYDPKGIGHVDRKGHGTSTAATIAGHGHGPGGRDGILGIAPKAKILPFTWVHPTSAVNPPGAVAEALDAAIASGAQVICMPLDSGFDSGMDRVLTRAWESGAVVVAAAGGDIGIGYPASHKKVLAAGQVDKDGNTSKPGLLADHLDLVAPGFNVPVAQPGGGYTVVSGSSVSAAIVAGAVALILAKYPGITKDELFTRLLSTTTDAGPPGRDLRTGWGHLNLRAALTGNPDPRRLDPDPLGLWPDGVEWRDRKPTAAASSTAAATGPEDDRGGGSGRVLLIGALVLAALAIPVVVLLLIRRPRTDQPAGSDA